jgi:tetratricopeptide (TPR) repeat protein
MDYKASDQVLESLREIFEEQVRASPDLTETIKPDAMFLLLESLRFLGIASVRVEKGGIPRYETSKGSAPIIIEEQKKRKNSGKLAEILTKVDLINTGKMNLSDAEIFLAETFLQEGKVDEALDTLEILEKTRLSDQVSSSIGKISRIKGAIEFFKGDHDASIKFLEDAVRQGEVTDDIDCVASSFLGLGNVYGSMGNYEEAFQKYERAYLLFKERDNLQGMARIKINQSYTYSKMGQLLRSTEANQEAIELCERVKDIPLLQAAYLNRSALLLVLGRHRDAYETTMSSYYLSLETGNKRIFHLARLSMLAIDISARKTNLDYQFLKEAIDYFEDISSEIDLAYCYDIMAQYYVANIMYEETRFAIKNVIDMYSKIQDFVGLEAAGIKILRVMLIYQSDRLLIKEANKSFTKSLEQTQLIKDYKEYIKQFLTKDYQT